MASRLKGASRPGKGWGSPEGYAWDATHWTMMRGEPHCLGLPSFELFACPLSPDPCNPTGSFPRGPVSRRQPPGCSLCLRGWPHTYTHTHTSKVGGKEEGAEVPLLPFLHGPLPPAAIGHYSNCSICGPFWVLEATCATGSGAEEACHPGCPPTGCEVHRVVGISPGSESLAGSQRGEGCRGRARAGRML